MRKKAAAVVPVKDPTLENVAGSVDSIFSNWIQSLPQWVDDITRDYGGGTYEKMLTDPVVDSCFSILKGAVLADGIQLVGSIEAPNEDEKGGVDPAEQADYNESERLRILIQRWIDGADTKILDIADEMLDGLYGAKVAEIILKHGEGEDAGKLPLRAVKPRPRQNLAFVVDGFMNTLGVVVHTPGSAGLGGPLLPTTIDLDKSENFVPISQLLVFRWRPKNGDPRGSSILRSAYNAWFTKTRVYPDYYKYLRQFASPSIVGKTPTTGSGFVPLTDAQGVPIMDGDKFRVTDGAAALLSTLLKFVNSAAMVVPGGTEVEIMFSDGDGEAFLKANDFFDRQISMGILNTTRLNQEAEHGSKADSGVAENVTGTRIQRIRKALQDCLDELSKFLVRINEGEDKVKFAPKFSLAGQEGHDWVKEIEAFAKVGWTIDESHLVAADKRLGFKPRDMEAFRARRQEAEHRASLRAGDLSKIVKPADDAEDEE